jgi:hypothetical protein
MERRDFPVLGRKVFFINPPLAISTYVFDALKEDQFEAYCIDNYKVAKSLLKNYPDSICFIFIDDQLTLREWYNFIKSFEYDEDLKSIFLGVISSRIRATDRDKFMLELKLPGGFVMLGGPVAGVYNTIKGILTVNGAKGRRKFIRYNCSDNKDISGYITHNMKIYPFKTNIISTSGIVSVFDKDTARLLQKGVRIQNLFLNVKRKNINLSGHVYDIKPGTKVSYVIILFDGDMDANVKSSILGFIYDNLKLKMDFEIYRAPGDTNDYTVDKPPKQGSGEVPSESFESPEANEILKEIGELEEVPQ